MYPKMIWFLSDQIEEPILRQYLQSSAKSTTYESSDSCDSFLGSQNSYLKNNLSVHCFKLVSTIFY